MTSFQQVKTETQIRTASQLAKEIWTEYFIPMIGEPQVKYMLTNMQSFEAMKTQISEGYQYYLIADDEQPIGYLCLKPADHTIFLSKLYLLKKVRGLGYGKLALAFIESYAKEHNKKTIWLTVNKGNTDTIEAYKKWGFEIVGEPVADIGGGFVMDDYRMEIRIS